MMQSQKAPRFESRVDSAPHITDPGGGHASPAAPAPASARTGALAHLRDSVWAPIVLKAGGGMIALCALGLMGAASLKGRPLGAPVAPASTEWVAAGDAPVASAAPAASAHAEPASAGSAPARASALPCVPSSAGSSSGGSSSASPPAPAEPGGVLPDGRVVLNRASVADLQRLPGVGQRRAEAIIELRERLKKFRRSSDLLRVRGIGPKSLKRLEPLFVIDAPAEAAPAVGAAPLAASSASVPQPTAPGSSGR